VLMSDLLGSGGRDKGQEYEGGLGFTLQSLVERNHCSTWNLNAATKAQLYQLSENFRDAIEPQQV